MCFIFAVIIDHALMIVGLVFICSMQVILLFLFAVILTLSLNGVLLLHAALFSHKREGTFSMFICAFLTAQYSHCPVTCFVSIGDQYGPVISALDI